MSAHEDGQTLVELSVYLVLTVLVIGLAMAAALAVRGSVAAWESRTAVTNAQLVAISRIDSDLREADAVTSVGPNAWDVILASGQRVRYRTTAESVFRNGRPLHPVSTTMSLILVPCTESPCAVGARLAVAPTMSSPGSASAGLISPRGPAVWSVLLRSTSWVAPSP